MNDLTVLIVDDEERMRKLIKDFLTKAEFSTLEAADGEEAGNRNDRQHYGKGSVNRGGRDGRLRHEGSRVRGRSGRSS